MHFSYCPYCGKKLTNKKIGDEGIIPYCNNCNIPLWDMFTTSIISAVINENNEIALLKQNYVSKTNYVLVAGIMKTNESAESTAIREIKEELGLDVTSLEFIKTYTYPKKEMLMIGFKANVKKSEFIISEEVNSAIWVKLDSSLNLLREGGIGWQIVKNIIDSNN